VADQKKLNKKTREGGKLTNQQRLFADNYCISLNALQAARAAGYTEEHIYANAYRVMRYPHVKKYIEGKMSEAAEKLGITKEMVLDALWSNAQRCRQAEQVTDKEGNPIGEYKFDSGGANKALELVGRHLQMFVDKKEISATVTHEDALKALAGDAMVEDKEE
jgi:phage terminase small subunit